MLVKELDETLFFELAQQFRYADPRHNKPAPFRVPDNRVDAPHGDSGKPAYGYRIARLAKDLEELLEHLNLKDVTLLGWSMGCSVIWGYWDLFRDKRIAKLILCDEAPLNLIQENNPHGFADYQGLVGLAESIHKDPDAALAGFDVGMFIDPSFKEQYLEQFVEESVKFPAKECNLFAAPLLCRLEGCNPNYHASYADYCRPSRWCCPATGKSVEQRPHSGS